MTQQNNPQSIEALLEAINAPADTGGEGGGELTEDAITQWFLDNTGRGPTSQERQMFKRYQATWGQPTSWSQVQTKLQPILRAEEESRAANDKVNNPQSQWINDPGYYDPVNDSYPGGRFLTPAEMQALRDIPASEEEQYGFGPTSTRDALSSVGFTSADAQRREAQGGGGGGGQGASANGLPFGGADEFRLDQSGTLGGRLTQWENLLANTPNYRNAPREYRGYIDSRFDSLNSQFLGQGLAGGFDAGGSLADTDFREFAMGQPQRFGQQDWLQTLSQLFSGDPSFDRRGELEQHLPQLAAAALQSGRHPALRGATQSFLQNRQRAQTDQNPTGYNFVDDVEQNYRKWLGGGR